MSLALVSMDAIIQANNNIGQKFFHPDTMRWFGSKIESQPITDGNLSYFITSEQDPEAKAWYGERRYTIRFAEPDGRVDTWGDFGAYWTLDEARVVMFDIIRTA